MSKTTFCEPEEKSDKDKIDKMVKEGIGRRTRKKEKTRDECIMEEIRRRRRLINWEGWLTVLVFFVMLYLMGTHYYW